jgi:hypothetical protein
MDAYLYNRKRFSCRQFVKELVYGFVTEYETPKIVMIHSYAITTLLRIMQIVLLLYSVFYLLLYEKGYQKHDTSIISSITLKVKGIGLIHTPENETYVLDGSGIFVVKYVFIRILFFEDYIIPPSENNAIFIMTNFILTDQTRSACTESASVSEAQCRKDSDCQNKPFMSYANGRWTGRCIFPSEVINSNQRKQSTGLCEMQGKINFHYPSAIIEKSLTIRC